MIGSRIRYTLGKEEKLRHKTLVDGVFSKGKTLYEYPLRLSYRILDGEKLAGSFRREVPAGIGRMQMMITVPKKKMKRAVDRVRMRRLIREAYRLNRHVVSHALPSDAATLSLAFVYLNSEKADYQAIERKMKRLLGEMARRLRGCESSQGKE